jgi:AcrR family transcriptional regulator
VVTDKSDKGLKVTLIAAALDILEATGEEPSLRAVARAAGVSAMAPYNHFPDKVSLLSAVASHGYEALKEVLSAADQGDDPRKALAAQGIAFVEFAQCNPALFRLMYSHQYGGADTEAVRATYNVLADRVAGILPSHASAATLACRALVQGIATILLNERLAPSGPDDVAIAVQLLVNGLKAGVG